MACASLLKRSCMSDCDNQFSYRSEKCSDSCRQNGINEYFKKSTISCLQASMQPSSILSLVLPSSLSSFLLTCYHSTLSSCCFTSLLSPLAGTTSSSLVILPSLLPLFLVMLAPCRSCSMPSLTCLRTAVMKILRRRRILHGFSLGPGTPLHGVCLFVCACSVMCPLHVPVGPRGLTLTANKHTRVER